MANSVGAADHENAKGALAAFPFDVQEASNDHARKKQHDDAGGKCHTDISPRGIELKRVTYNRHHSEENKRSTYDPFVLLGAVPEDRRFTATTERQHCPPRSCQNNGQREIGLTVDCKALGFRYPEPDEQCSYGCP